MTFIDTLPDWVQMFVLIGIFVIIVGVVGAVFFVGIEVIKIILPYFIIFCVILAVIVGAIELLTPDKISKDIIHEKKGIHTTFKPDYDELANRVRNYVDEYVKGVNTGDLTEVNKYMLKNSNIYKEQARVITTLYEKELQEEKSSFEIQKIYRKANRKFYVTTYEQIDVKSPLREYTTRFIWRYTVVYKSNNYYLTDIKRVKKVEL